jgi:uncharacterized protein (TIGR03083 family)
MDTAPDRRLWDLVPHERAEVIRGEVSRIADRLQALDPDRLDAPAIGEWTVREVVAHLAMVAGFYKGSIDRGAAGKSGAPANRPEAGTGRGTLAAAGVLQQATELAEALRDEVVDRLRQAGGELADRLDRDESELGFDCYHPGGILTASRFAVLYLKELGLHEWDVFEALEPPCSMSRWGVDAAFQAMEEEVASGSLRWVTDSEVGPDRRAIRVVTTGAVAAERVLLLEPDGTRLVDADGGHRIDGTIELDAADFVLGCSGRVDLVAVMSEGRVEGDHESVAMLAGRLTGM